MIECGDTINADDVLNNPLDCTSGNLTINGTGPFTVGLYLSSNATFGDADDVFLTPDDDLPAARCGVTYQLDNVGGHQFRARLQVKNQGDRSIDGWTLRFAFANGQTVGQARGAEVFQRGVDVAVRSRHRIPKGGTVTDVSFTGRWDNAANAEPTNFTLNGARCARE